MEYKEEESSEEEFVGVDRDEIRKKRIARERKLTVEAMKVLQKKKSEDMEDKEMHDKQQAQINGYETFAASILSKYTT